MNDRRRALPLLTLIALAAIAACSPEHEAPAQTTRAATFPADGDWTPILQAGVGLGDPDTDGNNGGREIIGDATFPAFYVYADGTDFFLRLRLDRDPSGSPDAVRPFGWGVLIDTDGNLLDYEFLMMVDGTGPDEIVFAQNTSPDGTGDPRDVAETDLLVTPVNAAPGGNLRITTADSTFGGDADFFLDFSVPLSAITAAGLSLDDSVQFIAGTSNSARALDVDIAGTPTKPGANTLDDSASDVTSLDGSPADVDGDGVLDSDDLDDDNDGIPDSAENSEGLDPAGDNDSDGVPNWRDADDRGDGTASDCADSAGNGICDAPGSLFDTDGDGVPNHEDLDTDNDGIPDLTEAGHGATDSDGDGMVDGPYGTNGLADAVETTADSGTLDYAILDTDGDGTRDFQDLDSDGNGATDLEESGGSALDTDDDGRIDTSTTDGDGDGLIDVVDADDDTFGFPSVDVTATDTDGDGIPDPYDADDGAPGDSDSDGLSDADECPLGWPCPDTDGDGTPDYMTKQDSDGDGVPNGLDDAPTDPNVCRDTDLDGCDDCTNTGADGSGGDPANDGPDTDGDGTCDLGESDGDGDGVADVVDTAPADPNRCIDLDEDGCDDCTNTGADGSGGDPDDDGLDTDGDGACDAGDADDDNDGVDDADDANDTNPNVCRDTDGDTCDDCTNTGADGSGGDPDDDGLDTDGDGACDAGDDDDDNDGVDDADDANDTNPNVCRDTDGDTCDDCTNTGANGSGGAPANDGLDTDGDGTCDAGEEDGDGDGLIDELDADDDDDGIPDADENLEGIDPDADNDDDGVPNYMDPDDRGDGSANDCTDTDPMDDVCDELPPLFDTDGDGVPNHKDLDADGDGIGDADESGAGGTDADEDGRVDGEVGGNGIPDDVETSPDSGDTAPPVDSDDDGTPDFLDLDSDGDGISDEDESGGVTPGTDPVDSDGDETPDYLDDDSDADGLPDSDEAGDGDLETPPVDTDGDDLPDFLDTDSDGDGIDDDEDNCPTVENEDQVDLDEDGLGDACDDDVELGEDSDGDGIDDGDDNCADVDNADQSDADHDGLGDACDPDANGDGFDDDLGIQGGGCAAAGGTSGSGAALLLLLVLGVLSTGRRRARALAGMLGLAAAVALATPATAQTVSTQVPVERFQLATDRTGILDVESGAVLPHHAIDAALWFGYANDPLNLYRTDAAGERERTGALVASRLSGNFVAALGIKDRGQIGIEVPLILSQDNDLGDGTPMTSLTSFGLGDLRLVPKVQILRQATHAVDVSILLPFVLPTSSSEDYFGESTAVFEPQLAASRTFGRATRGAANVGYRARGKTDALGLTVDDEVYARVGAGHRLDADGGPPVEIDATFALATGANDFFGAFNRNHAEAKVGAVYDVDRRWQVFAASGVGLAEGFGTPDWRFLLGARFDHRRGEPVPMPVEATPIVEGPKDSDGDGLMDPEDRCPTEPETQNGFEDDDGCPDALPDSDGDGLVDADDTCPNEPEDADRFEDTDGCPDPDNDNDGVVDTEDQCRDEPGVVAMRGCPDPDRDGDTVVDRLDNCPDEPGDPANHGCTTKQLVQITEGKLDILDVVYFRTAKAVIRKKSFPLLENIASVLNSHPEITKVRIEGHTDDRGKPAYNKDLSQRRAEAVVEFLILSGVDAGRLEAIGYGPDRPIADNGTKDGRAANRRVEFKIVGEASSEIEQQRTGPTDDTIDE